MQTRRPLFTSGLPHPETMLSTDSPEQLLRDAVTARNHVLAEFLLLHNGNPNHNDGRTTPLVIASWNSDIDMVNLLLKYSADATAPSPDPAYPSLLAACFTPNISAEIIAALRRAGAVDSPATQPRHRTLAQRAAEAGRADILALL